MTKSIKYVKGEPWQGKGRKADLNKVLTAPCGCEFTCGHFHWFRTKDCPKLKAFIIQSIIDANARSDKWGEETRRLIRKGEKK